MLPALEGVTAASRIGANLASQATYYNRASPTHRALPTEAPVCTTANQDQPAAVEPGSPDYYEQRYEDFKARNPCATPPDYYLGYGQKYLERFESLDSTDLTAEGLAWRDRTVLALQQKIEDLRISDPAKFAELERDPDAFREFAFGTHPDAYVESGLYDLPVQDLMVIAATPDIGDVLSIEGIKQTLVTLGKLSLSDLPEIAWDTTVQYYKDGLPFSVFVTVPPLGPAVAGLRQGERIWDRITDQSWFPF